MNNRSENELMKIIEGILFVYGDEGISLLDLETVLDQEKPSQIKKAIASLSTKYEKDDNCAFSVQKFNPNKYRLQTKPELYPHLAKLEAVKAQNKLSASAIEVLSVIAYQGPIMKSAIDEIRGVDSTYQIAKLKDYQLIRVTGRNPETRANLYGITDNFFKIFNLNQGLESLPKISHEEIELTVEQETTKAKQTKDIFFNLNDDWNEEN